MANGGPVGAGKPYLVGEEGPELFMPKISGDIYTNRETAGMFGGGAAQGAAPIVNVTPPQVNVSVVNVTDPKEVVGAMSSPEGEKTIMNIIRRNPRAIRSAVG